MPEGGSVAAQRSSGLPRRQGGSPSGADGRRCQAAGRAERSPAPTDDGNREGGPGRTERQAVHQAGRERHRGATPATATHCGLPNRSVKRKSGNHRFFILFKVSIGYTSAKIAKVGRRLPALQNFCMIDPSIT